MLRLRVKLCRGGSCVEALAVANSGFVGFEPEILAPLRVVEPLLGRSPRVELVERVLADGSVVQLPRTVDPVDVLVVSEDRVAGPVPARVYLGRGLLLLNDKLLSKLGVAIIDPGEGLWCFRDELGVRVRKGY